MAADCMKSDDKFNLSKNYRIFSQYEIAWFVLKGVNSVKWKIQRELQNQNRTVKLVVVSTR